MRPVRRYRLRSLVKSLGGNLWNMELVNLVEDIASILEFLDRTAPPFKNFRPGIGPYGEPQLLKLVAEKMNELDQYSGLAKTMRCPDLLIRGEWAIEFKLARPFGDNGKEAESWSVNLLHPYAGNVSVIGDCFKLINRAGPERKAVAAIGYMHDPPILDLEPLFRGFELLATQVAKLRIGPRASVQRGGLTHPVHQQVCIAAWEVLA